jgi:hypothetical protein
VRALIVKAAGNPLFLDRAALTCSAELAASLTLSQRERGLVARDLQTRSKSGSSGWKA